VTADKLPQHVDRARNWQACPTFTVMASTSLVDTAFNHASKAPKYTIAASHIARLNQFTQGTLFGKAQADSKPTTTSPNPQQLCSQ
jgi:hypothetical protein